MKKLADWLLTALACVVLYLGVSAIVVGMQREAQPIGTPQRMCPFIGDIQIACAP